MRFNFIRVFLLCFSIISGSIAQENTASCAIPDNYKQQIEQVSKLSTRTYDEVSLECAMNIYLKIASQSRPNVEDIINALLLADKYAFHLALVRQNDLYRMDAVNIARQDKLQVQLQVILKIAKKLASWVPEVKFFVAVSENSLPGMKAAVAESPAMLKGYATMRLGRELFEMPVFLGGDYEESIRFLTDAIKINSDNSMAWLYLAETFDEMGQDAEVGKSLAHLSSIDPLDVSDKQRLADAWRFGIGLATRSEYPSLVDDMTKRRNSLLNKYPELKNRASVAISRHGGENPLESN